MQLIINTGKTIYVLDIYINMYVYAAYNCTQVFMADSFNICVSSFEEC